MLPLVLPFVSSSILIHTFSPFYQEAKAKLTLIELFCHSVCRWFVFTFKLLNNWVNRL